MSRKERIAICLVAALVLVPLSTNPAAELLRAYLQSGFEQRLATMTLFVLMIQALVGFRQANISDRQQRLMREQHIAANRPQLRVRNFVLAEGHIFQNGCTLRGQFYISNIGGTSATIKESHCEFLWNVNGLPMQPPYEGKEGNNPIAQGRTIDGNLGRLAVFHTMEDDYAVWPFETSPGGGLRAYILGWIDYADEGGLARRTAFCREFLQGNGSARFYPVKDPDYEYEE